MGFIIIFCQSFLNKKIICHSKNFKRFVHNNRPKSDIAGKNPSQVSCFVDSFLFNITYLCCDIIFIIVSCPQQTLQLK